MVLLVVVRRIGSGLVLEVVVEVVVVVADVVVVFRGFGLGRLGEVTILRRVSLVVGMVVGVVVGVEVVGTVTVVVVVVVVVVDGGLLATSPLGMT